MPYVTTPSRRRFLTRTALGFAAAAGMPAWLRAMEGMGAMPRLAPNKASPSFNPDVELDLICRSGSIGILPGAETRIQQYVARLIKGPDTTLTNLAGSYLGPLMRFHYGQKVRIHLRNELSEPTITHWHGLVVPPMMDGHPMYTVDPGQTFVYEFEIRNRATMLLYHPHTHELTGRQVYHGLAGAMFINDPEEQALELPNGEYEVPLVIQDRMFDAQNQLVYVRHMHDRMTGFHGDRILVNGKPNFRLEVASRAYRLRILNGSNARIYKLAWDDGSPMVVIGVDGGLLEKPEQKPYVMLAPGERIDVWADFSGRSVGSQLVLRSKSFTGVLPAMAQGRMQGMHGMGMMEGMHGMMGSQLPVGSDYPIATVEVTRSVGESPNLPLRLSKFDRYDLNDTVNPTSPLPIGISEAPMAMLLNGRPYAFNDIQPYERIPHDTVQLMEIFHAHGGAGGHGNSAMGGSEHGGGMGRHSMQGMGMGMGGGMGMMMSMAHPIHLHEQPFQIISRTIGAGEADDYSTVRDGFIDSGWKDTVLVMPGERVKIAKPFKEYTGLFMMHCHNLEHEDMGMMRDLLVV